MESLITILIFIAGWIILNRFILPKMGIKT